MVMAALAVTLAQARAAVLDQVATAPMAAVVVAVGILPAVRAVLEPHPHSIRVRLTPTAVAVVVALVMVLRPVSVQRVVEPQGLVQGWELPLARISLQTLSVAAPLTTAVVAVVAMVP